jgi:cytochrome b6-f complex iron-sulfur subunit
MIILTFLQMIGNLYAFIYVCTLKQTNSIEFIFIKFLNMQTENQVEKINRLEFLKKLGLSGASLMAVYCGVTMSSCKNEDSTTPITTGKTLTFDMGTTTYAKLLTKGGFHVDSTNSVVIANTSDNGYVAVTLICTHEGQRQVASRALTTYKVTQTGNVLSVAI